MGRCATMCKETTMMHEVPLLQSALNARPVPAIALTQDCQRPIVELLISHSALPASWLVTMPYSSSASSSAFLAPSQAPKTS